MTENVVEGLRHTSPHTHAHDRSVVGPNPGAGEGRWRLRTATTSEGGHPANAQEPTQNHNALNCLRWGGAPWGLRANPTHPHSLFVLGVIEATRVTLNHSLSERLHDAPLAVCSTHTQEEGGPGAAHTSTDFPRTLARAAKSRVAHHFWSPVGGRDHTI